jgi:error-prone DNA polymerase
MQLKGLREEVVKQIVAERTAGGTFRSLRHFLDRLRPDPGQVRALIKAGCFDSVSGELTRPALLWQLFAWHNGSPRNYLPIPQEYPERQRIGHEIESFGFPLHVHPLDLTRCRSAYVSQVPAREMTRHVGRPVTMIGVLITEKIVQTKNGNPMAFVTFEDKTALFDATLFPDAYRRSCHFLAPNQAYLMKGVVEQQFGTVTLTVRELCSLGELGGDDAPVQPVQYGAGADNGRCENS